MTKFPMAVWLQDPAHPINGKSTAQCYADIGINTWMGIYDFPREVLRYPGYTDNAAQALRDAGFAGRVFAGEDGDMVAWLQAHPQHQDLFAGMLLRDEPDMTYNRPENDPDTFRSFCLTIREGLAGIGLSRLKFWANFGKGFAKIPWSGNWGASQMELSQRFAKLTDLLDIASVDFYAMTDPYEHPGCSGLWFYRESIRNLRYWIERNTRNPRIDTWGFVECGNPFSQSGGYKPFMPPTMIPAAVWMQIIGGARGLTYFPQHYLNAADPANPIHATTGNFPLDFPYCGLVMKAVNEHVQRFADILLDGTPIDVFSTVPLIDEVPPLVTARRSGDTIYVFAIGNGDATHKDGFTHQARISIPLLASGSNRTLNVVDENRPIDVQGGVFTDRFDRYQLRIYEMSAV